MGKKEQPDFGEQIEELVQNAIDTLNFDQLSKNIGRAVNKWNKELQTSIKPSFQQMQEGLEGVKEKVQNSFRFEKVRRGEPIKKKLIVPVNKRASLKVKGMLFTVFSSVFLIGFGVTTFILIIAALLGQFTSFGAIVGFLIPTLISLGFLSGGIDILQKHKRMMRYIELLKIKGYVDIKELEQYVCIGKKKILKEVKEMLHLGLLPEGHLDENNTCLIGTNEIYDQYREAEEAMKERELWEAEQKKKMEQLPEEQKEILSEVAEGKELLIEISQVKAKLSKPELSIKLERLESISEKIFLYVEENPEQVEEIHRLKNYYLPTILKLVKAYERLQGEEFAGQNIKKMCVQIEDTLDTMNEALETMYDELYSVEAMDVSADISVLKTMLAREGLVKEEWNKGKQEEHHE